MRSCPGKRSSICADHNILMSGMLLWARGQTDPEPEPQPGKRTEQQTRYSCGREKEGTHLYFILPNPEQPKMTPSLPSQTISNGAGDHNAAAAEKAESRAAKCRFEGGFPYSNHSRKAGRAGNHHNTSATKILCFIKPVDVFDPGGMRPRALSQPSRVPAALGKSHPSTDTHAGLAACFVLQN